MHVKDNLKLHDHWDKALFLQQKQNKKVLWNSNF